MLRDGSRCVAWSKAKRPLPGLFLTIVFGLLLTVFSSYAVLAVNLNSPGCNANDIQHASASSELEVYLERDPDYGNMIGIDIGEGYLRAAILRLKNGTVEIIPDYETRELSAPFQWATETGNITAALSRLKRSAEVYLNESIWSAVIAVPTYDDMYPDIRKAANLAGFPNIRLSKNPIATALNYDFLKMDKHSGKEAINLLVVDLGMSLDLTIMEEEEPSIFDILAVKRIAVGGKTFNRNLAQLLGKKLGSGHFETMEAEGMIEETKRQLSARSRVDIEIGNRKTTITRQEFEEANSEVFEEILGHIDKFLEQNNFTAANIDEIIFAGASASMAKLHKLLADHLNLEPRWDPNPGTVAVKGAAIQAARISQAQSECTCVHQITPTGFGIEVTGGLLELVVQRNTVTPFKISKTFTTSYENQTTIEFKIYEQTQAE